MLSVLEKKTCMRSLLHSAGLRPGSPSESFQGKKLTRILVLRFDWQTRAKAQPIKLSCCNFYSHLTASKLNTKTKMKLSIDNDYAQSYCP